MIIIKKKKMKLCCSAVVVVSADVLCARRFTKALPAKSSRNFANGNVRERAGITGEEGMNGKSLLLSDLISAAVYSRVLSDARTLNALYVYISLSVL